MNTGRVFYLHFNKIAVQRNDPRVWSIRTSKGCFHAEHVYLEVPLETVNRPHLRTNPRYFLKGRRVGGFIEMKDGREFFAITQDGFSSSLLAKLMIYTTKDRV